MQRLFYSEVIVVFSIYECVSRLMQINTTRCLLDRMEQLGALDTQSVSLSSENNLHALLVMLQASNTMDENHPMKLEGWQEVKEGLQVVKEATRSAYNKYGWMSAGFVADKCAAILAVCGDRLTIDLQVMFVEFKKALRKAQDATNVGIDRDHIKYLQNENVKRDCLNDVVVKYWRMWDVFWEALKVLIGTQEKYMSEDAMYAHLKQMKDDPLAMALVEFLYAMKQYRQRHKANFRGYQ
jgi:hypothetical protein